MENNQTHAEILTLLQQNQALLLENNAILKRQEKRAQIGMVLKVVWIFVLVILPLLLLPYLISGLTASLGIDSGVTAGDLINNANSTRDLLNSLPK